MRKCLLALFVSFGTAFALLPARGHQPNDERQAMVEKAIAFLKKTQNEDGSWGKEPQNRGQTGIVVTGLIGNGVKPGDPPVAKAIAFIESLVNQKEGHIAGNDAKASLINYTTSINVMALTAADKEKYKIVIGNAAKYLKEYQWDEARGKKADSDFYGGAGYAGDKSRPDLSNTAFFLEALKDAGFDKNDPTLQESPRLHRTVPESQGRVQHRAMGREE